MNELAAKECVPCKGGVPPLKGEDLVPRILFPASNLLCNRYRVYKQRALKQKEPWPLPQTLTNKPMDTYRGLQ